MKYLWLQKSIVIVILVFACCGILGSSVISNQVVHASNQDAEYSKTKEIAQKKAKMLINGYGSISVEYALIDHGKVRIADQEGTYSKNQTVALTKNHMYGIGSISKIYTAAAVMKLVEEGKLYLDSPVTDYVKEFSMADKRYQKITVRMLLNHSSGIMGSSFQNEFLLDDNDTKAHDSFLKKLSKQGLKSNPGEFSVYSNDSFTLAEILVERVSKKSFSAYIREVFIKPLQLSYTYTPQDKFNELLLAKTYYPGFTQDFPIDSVNAIGTGGIYSTAQELCQFATTFMEESNGLLSKESIMTMENKEYERGIWPAGKDTTLGYGLGWDCVELYPFHQYGIKALAKGGDTLFYHSALIVLPEHNMAVAVLSSGGASLYNQIMAQEILLAALAEKNIIENIKEDKSFQQPVPVNISMNLKQYAGNYGTQGGVLSVEFNEKNQLIIWNPLLSKEHSQRFTHIGNGIYVIVNGKNYSSIEFVKESNGKTYIRNQNYTVLPGIGQTVSNYYIGQKLSKNAVTESVNQAWLVRSNQKYFLINEKYSSQAYPASLVINSFAMSEDVPGYAGNIKILNKNNGKSVLEIPGVHGRDLVNYRFFVKDKKEYLEVGDGIFISEKGISEISNKNRTVTIGQDGYAQWYKISNQLAGKTMSVTTPKESAYVVYDGKGNCIRYSYMDQQNQTVLPQGGYIAFVSKKGTKFKVFFE